jgi:excisionase family DNA binding protein
MSIRVAVAAKRLSIDVKVLRAMAARGDVPATKLGKVWIFDEDLLDEWLRERCRANIRTPLAQPLLVPTAARTTLSERLDRLLAEGKHPSKRESRRRAANAPRITMLPPIGEPSAHLGADLVNELLAHSQRLGRSAKRGRRSR